MDRRTLVTGLVAFLATPAIVRAGSLMPLRGDRYFFWDYRCPMLPDMRWVEQERQDLIDSCFGPNGRPYIGVWTHFGKNRNIYSDEVVAFRKFEAPPHVSDAVLVGAT